MIKRVKPIEKDELLTKHIQTILLKEIFFEKF